MARKHGLVGGVVEGNGRARQIIQQGFEMVMEQGQPVLHALIAPAIGDRFIERVIQVEAAEGRGIAGAETADGFG